MRYHLTCLIVVGVVLAACNPIRVTSMSSDAVGVQWDPALRDPEDARRLAETTCARYGKTAKLQATNQAHPLDFKHAFYDCVTP
jgi:hypothetical protein